MHCSILLHHGAPVDSKDSKGRTPLFYASMAGSLVDINVLLKYGANVNHKSDSGRTALYKSRTYDTVMLLLKYGADYTIRDKENKTAIEFLMKYNSSCPKAILDDCMIKQPDETLIMDLQVFDCKEKSKHEMDLFLAVKEQRRTSLFLHPLMRIFMSLKFSQVKVYFMFIIILQLTFTITFSYLGIRFTDFIHCKNDSMNAGYFISTWNNTKLSYNETAITCYKNTLTLMTPLAGELKNLSELAVLSNAIGYSETYWHNYWLTLLVESFLVLRIIIEIYWIGMYTFYVKNQTGLLFAHGLLSYLSKLPHFIDNLIIALTTSFLVLCNYNIDLASHIVGWIVFLVWIDLMLLLGKMNTMGRYILMSVSVMKTMLVVLVTYIPFIFAFVFGFYVLLNSNVKFRSYSATIIKVLSMMVGELNYDDHFSYDGVIENGGRNISTQVMFVLFVISVMLIIVNLLLAVTVNKTEGLVEESIKMQTKERIDDVIRPTVAPKWIINFRKCYQTKSIQQKKRPIFKTCKKDRKGNYKVKFSFQYLNKVSGTFI